MLKSFKTRPNKILWNNIVPGGGSTSRLYHLKMSLSLQCFILTHLISYEISDSSKTGASEQLLYKLYIYNIHNIFIFVLIVASTFILSLSSFYFFSSELKKFLTIFWEQCQVNITIARVYRSFCGLWPLLFFFFLFPL